MNTETKALGQCRTELKVTLDAEEMKSLVKKVEAEFVREVRLPGFRPGKVPREMIRERFAKPMAESVQREAVSLNINAAIKAANLDAVAVTEVKDFTRDDEGAVFTAIVEVKPVFELPSYKGLQIEKKDTSVSDEMLENEISAIRAANAKFEDAKEGETVAMGDFAQIDYSATVDGKPLSEVSAEAGIFASRQGFWVQLEEGRFMPEIIAALEGMKAGETKEGVEVAFGDNAPDSLKGVKASYTIALKMFRRRILPTDEALATTMKAESFDAFAADLRSQMAKYLDSQEAQRRENEALSLLLKKVDFDVPSSMVRNTRDNILRNIQNRVQASGMSADYLAKNAESILKDAEEEALKQVRTWYLMDAIASAENIPEGDNRFKNTINRILELSV